MSEVLPARPRKGRGAVSNGPGRFQSEARAAVDDGWADEAEAEAPETVVLPDRSRSVIAWNDSPDIGFDRSVNPYRGCEHGCVYCFARPTHAYFDLSPGLDFETRIFAKYDAAALLRAELARPSYAPATLTLGAVTDPYQPAERRLGITRQVIEVLAEARHPFSIVTKSPLVLRDLDLLGPLGARRLARVMVSVTTLDRGLARRLEPRAPTPPRRLEAVARLAAAGVPVGVLAAPMIPALNDHELEAILAAAAEAGAATASYVLLRLPHEIKDLFAEWLEAHAPGRKDHVLSLVRQARSGRLNDPRWGSRMKGQGAYAGMLAERCRLARRRLGLEGADLALDASQFRRPAADPRQMRLL